jgi:hypothetical protein
MRILSHGRLSRACHPRWRFGTRPLLSPQTSFRYRSQLSLDQVALEQSQSSFYRPFLLFSFPPLLSSFVCYGIFVTLLRVCSTERRAKTTRRDSTLDRKGDKEDSDYGRQKRRRALFERNPIKEIATLTFTIKSGLAPQGLPRRSLRQNFPKCSTMPEKTRNTVTPFSEKLSDSR